MPPKLSIITVNLNNADGLNETIESVKSQTFRNFEFIVIDGNSSDGSVDILKKNASEFTFWCTEKDSSIFDAMNKGINHAIGQYCMFLNSGDYLSRPTILDEIFAYSFNEDIIYGDLLLHIPMKILGKPINRVKLKKSIPTEKLCIEHFIHGTIPHQASLIRTDLLKNSAGYRMDLAIGADWAFYVEAIYRKKATYKHLPLAFCFFSMTGLSTNPKNWPRMREERRKIWMELFPDNYQDIYRLSLYKEAWELPGVQALHKLYVRYRAFRQFLTTIRKFHLS